MPIGICPRCQQRYSYNEYDSDAVHQCNSQSLALNQEDVLVVGPWMPMKNENNEGVEQSTYSSPMLQGLANRLQGTRAGIDGERVDHFTVRGARAANRRQRQYYEYISSLRVQSKNTGVNV